MASSFSWIYFESSSLEECLFNNCSWLISFLDFVLSLCIWYHLSSSLPFNSSFSLFFSWLILLWKLCLPDSKWTEPTVSATHGTQCCGSRSPRIDHTRLSRLLLRGHHFAHSSKLKSHWKQMISFLEYSNTDFLTFCLFLYSPFCCIWFLASSRCLLNVFSMSSRCLLDGMATGKRDICIWCPEQSCWIETYQAVWSDVHNGKCLLCHSSLTQEEQSRRENDLLLFFVIIDDHHWQ